MSLRTINLAAILRQENNIDLFGYLLARIAGVGLFSYLLARLAGVGLFSYLLADFVIVILGIGRRCL